jgi:hypothetical protein
MRGSLLHPLGERRARRTRGAHRATSAQADIVAASADIVAASPIIAAWVPERSAAGPDVAAQRVREAGGPTDLASYSCACGYLFAAAVTTTVACPHCGTTQAW